MPDDESISPSASRSEPPADAARPALRVARLVVWLTTIGVLATLAMGWLWPALEQRAFWAVEVLNYLAFAIRTLSFHLGIGVVGLIGCALVLRQWRVAAFVLVPMACFLLPPDALWLARAAPPAAAPAPAAGSDSSDARPDVIVLSQNAFLGKVDVNAVAAAAREHDVDVVVVQEVHAGTMAKLRRVLGDDYPHSARESQSAVYGHAAFSRYPFVEASRSVRFVDPPRDPHPFRMNAGDGQQRIVIEIDERRLVIQNIHFVSPADPGTVAEQGRQVAGLIDTLGRESFLEEGAAPILLIGDFNSTPRSAAHAWLRGAGLREVHGAVGTRRGGTWPARSRWVPGFLAVRIDHAWVNGAVVPRLSRVIGSHGSDHRGIVVGLDLGD